MLHIAVLGGSGGIGAAIVAQLAERADVSAIYSTYFRSETTASRDTDDTHQNTVADVHYSHVDATNDASVKQWLDSIGSFDWLINCAGFLHDKSSGPEKAIGQFESDHFIRCMQINCLSTMLLAKYAGPVLRCSERGIFAALTAKVGSIEDNRLGGWYSYRASKAAANMVLKSLSIEWQRLAPNIRVLALHPGTTDTQLSKPFQSRVAPDKLFSVEKVAALLLAQLDQAHDYPSGRFIAYDGEELPW